MRPPKPFPMGSQEGLPQLLKAAKTVAEISSFHEWHESHEQAFGRRWPRRPKTKSAPP